MKTSVTKTALAKSLGISRQSLYYVPKRPHRDEKVREQILNMLSIHPAYGSRPLAWALKMNRKKVQRIMRRYAIRPRILAKNRYRGKPTESVVGEVPNRARERCPVRPNALWAGDFTHLWFRGRELYLATIIDGYTREIIAWQIGLHHTAGLVVDVLEEALRKRKRTPELFHSDQGSEYTSSHCLLWLTKHHILPSWSPKGKPWHNGMQESFYRTFKLEFGSPQQFPTLESLLEGIGKYLHYYNTQRIHRRLRMPPKTFSDQKSIHN